MTFPRIFLATFLVLFALIGFAALTKKKSSGEKPPIIEQKVTSGLALQTAPIEITLTSLQAATKKVSAGTNQPREIQQEATPKEASVKESSFGVLSGDILPDADNVGLLFQKHSPLPIVETVQYKSQPAWKKSRAAWLVDYASHYKTHLHFIARSLNGKPDYTPKAAREGDSFTVLSQKENFHFYLLVDLARCKMWFYYVRPDQKERFLIKTYRVGLGRIDQSKASGCLTPTGIYRLGSRVAVFQPKMMGNHKGQKVELMRVFGTRWIPFEKEIEDCSEPAKSYGIHGTPWNLEAGNEKLSDNASSIGRYDSDGCIRLSTADIEELFSIIATHDTVVEIVSDYSKAKLHKQNFLEKKV